MLVLCLPSGIGEEEVSMEGCVRLIDHVLSMGNLL
jgi:hypothetical protein